MRGGEEERRGERGQYRVSPRRGLTWQLCGDGVCCIPHHW